MEHIVGELGHDKETWKARSLCTFRSLDFHINCIILFQNKQIKLY